MKIIGNSRPMIMAHRGDSAAAPENTLLSLRRAVEIGVDFLETDLRMTKDGELVLFHDETLERTTQETGPIRNKTLDELKRIDLGYNFTTDDGKSFPYRGKGHSIVTLAEAFEAFPETKFNIDIKDTDPKAPEKLAILIKEFNRESSVLVASFHDVQAFRFRKLMPEVASSACPSEISRFVFALKMRVLSLFSKKCEYEAFQVPMKYGRTQVVDSRFIRAAHDRGIAVHVWTINEREDMEELINLGVDGLFTDEPMILRDILLEKGML